MLAEVAARAPEARITGVSVQEMVRRPDAHELIAGIAEDPQFGPAILFGAGGVSVEVVDDKALGLPPLDMALAEDLIGQTRISRLLAGYRRRPAADRGAIAATLVRLSEIARALPMIRELDINPLLADETGVIAVDARIVVAPDRLDEPAPNRRLAIRPYPVELEGRLRLPDGSEVICRPIRPEDAALYPPAFEKMAPEDLRLRLFAPVAQAPMALVARLTQIDYARAMAFVALHPGNGALMGVARMTADPDMTNAEYGVLVRSDLKGRGIGWALMTRLIEHARAEGIAELWGDVLPENRGMLKMARELGFRVEPKPDEGLVRVRLDLSKLQG
jgi:acetyltransferase